MNIKAIIEYKGTNFKGWQSQPGFCTVQGTLEDVLSNFFGERVEITGSGRTDAGVHALGQVISFSAKPKNNFKIANLPNAVNPLLPKDIRILSAKKARESFNARFDVKKKTYLYKMYKSKTERPTKNEFALRIDERCDIAQMKLAAQYLLGEHDFAAFKASGAQNKNGDTRTIFSAKLLKRFDEIHFEICGNGFLYNMVRIIVGTLVEVGMGRLPVDIFQTAFLSGSRDTLGKTAREYGLYLKKVNY